MRSVCFLLVLIVVVSFEICHSAEPTTVGSDIDRGLSHKGQPKLYLVLLPPVFNVIGITLIALSVLTTIFCIAYCVFLPWATALKPKTIVKEVASASPSASTASQQQPFSGGGFPPHPYYAAGGGPYMPNPPYPYYAGPPPPTTECSTGTTTTTTTTTTKPETTTSPTPEQQNVKETEEFFCDE